MNIHKPLIVFLDFKAERFVEQLLLSDRQALVESCDLAEAGFFADSGFKQVPSAPTFWEKTIQSGSHEWCMLAFWDRRYIDTDYLVCTHGFTKVAGQIPATEIAEADRIRLAHFNVSKGGV